MYEDNSSFGALQSNVALYAVVYHVTTRYRADLIAAKGIDPERSKGKRKCSWYVSFPMLAWAIAHVSLRHKCPLENIIVIRCTIPLADLKKNALEQCIDMRQKSIS